MLSKIAVVSTVPVAVAFASCSGAAEPSASTCYEGAVGILGVKEIVKVNLKAYAAGKGTIDLSGTGIQGFTCSDHAFTKSGQAITTDLSDCLPVGDTVPSVKYCSDSDTIEVTIKDKDVPLPITATLQKVSCAASNESDAFAEPEASCSGTADPAASTCYEGAVGILGVKETVKVNLKGYAAGKGTIDLTGTGIQGFTCADHAFTKSGQAITTDLSDCLPAGDTVPSVKYCSDSDTIAVAIKDKDVPLPITATLKKVSCVAEDLAVEARSYFNHLNGSRSQSADFALFDQGSTCSKPGDCGRAYQVCCAGFAAKGFPCGCHLQDGTGSVGSGCGDCGTAYTACCLGFKAKGFPCTCDVDAASTVV